MDLNNLWHSIFQSSLNYKTLVLCSLSNNQAQFKFVITAMLVEIVENGLCIARTRAMSFVSFSIDLEYNKIDESQYYCVSHCVWCTTYSHLCWSN